MKHPLFTLLVLSSLCSSLSAQDFDLDQFCKSKEDAAYLVQFTQDEIEDMRSLCSLPRKVRNAVPKNYWLNAKDYQAYLKTVPVKPQAPATFGNVAGRAEISKIVSHPESCHFYSMISPTYNRGRVHEADKTKIIPDAKSLLQQCQILKHRIRAQEKLRPCHSIELAGHSTQSVGLDTVLSIQMNGDQAQILPSESILRKIGKCFEEILEPGAPVVFSTCGGERDDNDVMHFWEGKNIAQEKLTQLLGVTVISGVGPVRGSEEYSPDGVESEYGWFMTTPSSAPSHD